jgi:L-lactate dehydrogenase
MEQRNVSLVRSAVSAMAPFRSDTIILVVSNPNDLLVSIAQEASGLPVNQVFGSGTFLDSVRIRSLLAQDVGVSITSHSIISLCDIYLMCISDCAERNRHQCARHARAR